MAWLNALDEPGGHSLEVAIVAFPETKIAALEHRGPPNLEYQTLEKFIAWRREHHLTPDRHRSYGIHYNDPRTTAPCDYRVDFCASIEHDIPANPLGVVNKIIPAGRCALIRHIGSREYIASAVYLYDIWLPASGEVLRDFPMYFHYVNVGPLVATDEMITDVYLPLR